MVANTRGAGRACHRDVPNSLPLSQITADLLSNGIDVYPQKEFDEDSEDRLVNEKFRVSGSTGMFFLGDPQFLLKGVVGGGWGTLSHEMIFLGPESTESGCLYPVLSG